MKHRLSLLRGVALVTFAGYVESAVGLIAGVLIARSLGPENYGHYAYVIWLCGLLSTLCNHALTGSSIRYLAELRGAGQETLASALVGRLLRLQAWSSLLVLGGFITLVALHPPPEWGAAPWPIAAMVVLAVWARAGFWVRGAIGKGYERFEPENVPLALVATLNLALTALIAWRGGSVTLFLALYVALGFLTHAMARHLLRRSGIVATQAPLPDELHARLNRHLLLTGIMIILSLLTNRSLEMGLLRRHVDPASLGYFAIAGSLSKGAIDLLAGGLAAVLLPSMSRRFGEGGHARLARVLAESTRLYWFLGLAIAGLGSVAAAGAIRLLYGNRYEGVIIPLVCQLVVAGLTVTNGAAAAALSAAERQADRILVLLVSFGVNLLLAWLLIPHFGLGGAVASAAATQACVTLLNWNFAIRRTGVALPFGQLGRLALAGAIATGLGHAANQLHHPLAFVLACAVFIASYLLLTVLLRTWRRADYDLAANVLARLGELGRTCARLSLRLRERYGLPDEDGPG